MGSPLPYYDECASESDDIDPPGLQSPPAPLSAAKFAAANANLSAPLSDAISRAQSQSGSAATGSPPVMLAFHPHGIFSMSFWLGGVASPQLHAANPRVTFLISSFLHRLAPFCFILRWCGYAPADAATVAGLMRRGRDVALLPGGFEEATIYARGRHRVWLKRRRGFVKFALRHGYALLPVYTFGEERNYANVPGLLRLRLWLNRWQIPGVLPWGAPGLLPHSTHGMHTVFGAPLRLPRIAQPTLEDVRLWHGRYTQTLVALFDRNKARFGQPDAQLEIW